LCCTARVDLCCLGNGQTWAALLGSTFPLLAQEIFELVHQLLWAKVVLTPGVRCLFTCRVIVLLQLPDIGLDGGVLRDSLVTLAPKGLHGRRKGGQIEFQVEQAGDRGQQSLAPGGVPLACG